MIDQGIYVIIDGSGSMSGVKMDVVKGINEFIKEQQDEVKSNNDLVSFSLTSFDTNVQEVYVREDITLVKPVAVKQTFLGGGTALFDAIGRTLTGAEDDGALRNIVVIYTDGFENASKEFDKDQITELVEKLTDTGNWQFVYLGAEFEDFANDTVASTIAYASAGTAGFTNTSKGNVDGTWKNVSATTHYHRNANDATYASINTRGGLINSSQEDAGVDWTSVNEEDDVTSAP